MALSTANVEYFHTIESAMFLLCLDTGSPTTPEEIARQGYIGDGSNRWFDKALQFFVSANGRSGHIAEHAAIDGTTPVRLLEWVSKAMDEYVPAPDTGIDSLLKAEFEELPILQTTPEIDHHIGVLRKLFLSRASAATYIKENLDEFGTDFLLQSRVPVKGVIDLTFQLALRLFFGRNQPAWEPTSAAHFHRGRTDAVQRASPAVAAFCDAAAAQLRGAETTSDSSSGGLDSSNDNKARLLALVSTATKQMGGNMLTVLGGRSYLPAFEVLGYLWPRDADVAGNPRFLSEGTFFGRPYYPPVFAQCNAVEADLVFDHYVKPMSDPDGFWSIITPEKDM